MQWMIASPSWRERRPRRRQVFGEMSPVRHVAVSAPCPGQADDVRGVVGPARAIARQFPGPMALAAWLARGEYQRVMTSHVCGEHKEWGGQRD